jgi:Fe-S-cluster containining protein
MQAVNFYSFRQKVRLYKKRFKRFLRKIETHPPARLHKVMEEIDKEVWQDVDCLACANCCKKMTPTFTPKDIKRSAAHMGMSVNAVKEKWLYFDKKDKDWMNKKQPCQFLDLQTNMCSIYAVRPADCAGFPHLTKKKAIDYMHVHQGNIEYCPATYALVEKMMERITV